jgi:hypothetical protein
MGLKKTVERGICPLVRGKESDNILLIKNKKRQGWGGNILKVDNLV